MRRADRACEEARRSQASDARSAGFLTARCSEAASTALVDCFRERALEYAYVVRNATIAGNLTNIIHINGALVR